MSRIIITFLAVFSMFSSTTRAEVIGVNLEEEEDGRKPDDADGELITSSLRSDVDTVLKLNRVTFQGTILDEHEDPVPHWIVLFCPPWYEPCQALQPVFRLASGIWQERLNGALLSTEVRFAHVDCATEKALCNTQNVDTYPVVAHYSHRQQVKLWRGKSFETDVERLTLFLQKELGPIAAALRPSTEPTAKELAESEDVHNFRVDFLLIFAAIAGNAWFISRSTSGAEVSKPAFHSGPAPVPQHLPAEGPQSPAGLKPEAHSSCVERSLPKEWGRDRASFEL